jgi:polyisoprenyl-phosphate glycosyltransferase
MIVLHHMGQSEPRARLWIISPCFNEEEVITLFHKEVKAVLSSLENVHHTMLFVDDGSVDGTLPALNEIAARDPQTLVISLSRNFGHQVALTAGLDWADGDAVIMMDVDLQHPPALIPRMVKLWRDGYDVVSTLRAETADATFFKRFTSGLFYRVFNVLSDVRLVPGAADFCLLSRRAQDALKAMPERHRLLRGMIAWIGFNRTFVTYDAATRVAGRSKYGLARMFKLAVDSVLSFSAEPVRAATRVGLVMVMAAGFYFIYILFAALVLGSTVRGWSSLITLVIGLGGTQLVFIGLIGEYIARIYEESKGRPRYLVKQYPGETYSMKPEVVRDEVTGMES